MRQHVKKLMTIKFILPIGFLLLFFLLIFGVIFSLLLIISSDNGDESGGGVGIDGSAQVNEEIEGLRPLFEKYAKLHGIPEKVDLLMAIAMQESGGRHLDECNPVKVSGYRQIRLLDLNDLLMSESNILVKC